MKPDKGMYYTMGSAKPFDQAAADLDAVVRRHRFGALHVHDLGATTDEAR